VKRDGLTLLESMVALVILGLVVTGFLEVFQGSTRLATDAETWANGVVYAEEGMQTVKLGELPAHQGLPGGFERSVQTQAWRDGLQLVTVSVTLPNGGQVLLNRLVEQR